MPARRIALIVGSAVAVAFLVVDYAITSTAEERAQERVSNALGSPVEVDLGGWPLSMRLAAGRVPRIDVAAPGLSLAESDARLPSFRAQLRDVEMGLAGHVAGPGLPDFEVAPFRTELDSATLAEYLAGRHGVDDAVVADDQVRVRLDGEVRAATPVVDDGVAVLRTHADELHVDLEASLPSDARVQRAVAVDGRLRLTGVLLPPE